MGGVLGEDDVRRVFCSEKVGDFLSAVVEDIGGVPREAMGASSGVSSRMAHCCCDGTDDIRRLREGGGGVIEIDQLGGHGLFLAFLGAVVQCRTGILSFINTSSAIRRCSQGIRIPYMHPLFCSEEIFTTSERMAARESTCCALVAWVVEPITPRQS